MQTTTLSQVTRYKSSILPEKIKDIPILEIETIKEKENKGFGGGSAFSIEKVKTETGIIYLVYAASWGNDDVDENYHAFNTLRDAEYCYDQYINPLYKEIGVLARITRTNQQPKYIPETVNENGYFVTARYEGEVLVPYFNSKKLEELNLIDEAKALKNPELKNLIGTKFEIALLKWGMNEYNVFVQSDDEYRTSIVNENKTVEFQVHHCWETGLNYYQLSGRYPAEVFAIIKPVLQYHDEQMEEEGEWKGWFTFNIDAVNSRLQKIGWSC